MRPRRANPVTKKERLKKRKLQGWMWEPEEDYKDEPEVVQEY